jgi:predicted RecB family nuclease
MLLLDNVVVYSASDLAIAARCEYQLLRAFDAHLGWGPPLAKDDDLLMRTALLGDQHERRHLEEFRVMAGENPTIIGLSAYTSAGLTAAADATRLAVERRSPIIVQAAMFDGRFLGFADFLVLQEGAYRLRDTKLARSVKVTALLQLAGYADALGAAGAPIHDGVELALGDGTLVSYPAQELIPVYRSRRRVLQELLDDHYHGGTAVSWGDDPVRACLRCPECEIQVKAHNDVLLVAGVRVSQRARLIDAGIATIGELAEHQGPITGLSAAMAEKLGLQARLQCSSTADGLPAYEVVEPSALSGLPPASAGDLFFDFEGDPLWTSDGRWWGLEYLFGIHSAQDDFTPIWAHDRVEERQALRDFLDLVRERREQYPDMHIYHYANYERTALLKLAGNYGVGEEEVDDLLRANVFVDLFPLVRNSIRVGTKNYSLKSLEPLYMGDELRTGDVTTASDSIVMYAMYCDLVAEGRDDEAAAVLADIEQYNRYDCRSTLKLRDWLSERAGEHGVGYRRPLPPRDKKIDPVDEDETARALMAFAGDELGDRTAEQQAVALIAAARGYHKREDKPFWWGHFNRMDYPIDEWADTAGVFMVERAEVEEEWRDPEGREKKPRRRLRLHGELLSGHLDTENVQAMYDAPAPPSLEHHSNGRACNGITIKSVDDPVEPSEMVITELTPGKDGQTHQHVPLALMPTLSVSSGVLKDSINSVAGQVRSALPELPRMACLDILTRLPPRRFAAGPLPRDGNDITDITAAALELDRSYLAVHGPPGSGKTYTAARVIATLVNDHGWKVGVVAQSHSVVENLFDGIVGAKVDPLRVGKKVRKPGKATSRAWQPVDVKDYPAFIAQDGGCVIGGTAWDFAEPARVPPGSLDLLVVEEAGQFCLANTISVAVAARNLLLLGDPQQLPQVSQGTHFEPVEESALGWLVDGAPTLDPSLGYFLAQSWRMHSAVCRPVSQLSYAGRLTSYEERTDARRLAGQEPGVREILVDHDGNSTDSVEEADRIVTVIRALLGLEWTDEDGIRPLGVKDVLVVAAYNAQVLMIRRRLEQAGVRGVEVGTVDKFQGKEAPVVFFSLAASSAEDVPRGLSFLLNRNRVNVAISRAKYLAYVVRSPRLTDYLPSSPANLVELGAFLAVCSGSTHAGYLAELPETSNDCS